MSVDRVSVGFVIVCPGGLLVGHVTGGKHWDVPKGMLDPGELPLQGAIRELREETGLIYDHDAGTLTNAFTAAVYKVSAVKSLGRHPYKKGKDLDLFQLQVEADIDPSKLKCESMVERKDYSFPELDRFALIKGTQTMSLNVYLAPAMYAWLKEHMK